MAVKLEGRVAIITGSGSGMGKASASLYASEGAIVMIADFNEAAINETVKEITDAGGKASGFVADMSKENDIIDLVQATVERYDHVNILVNNA
ncbi:SDR family NAD(P)-dependent oxidoreductase, partial [Paucilactobacillus nenjiangensis]|uniref:SDR family NAD(P)-dependent oxidoreductase n=1 Tax=Paucilactobacillus nenjiangensis TaxID=1296540 RepID=UPI003BB7C808